MPLERPDRPARATVIYDGGCRLCQGFVDRVATGPGAARPDLVDYTRQAVPDGLARADLGRELHVIGTDGKVYRNIDAVAKVLETRPGWRWAARVLRLPGICQVAAALYRLIARHRHLL